MLMNFSRPIFQNLVKQCQKIKFRSYNTENIGKTAATILNRELGAGLMIDSFSQIGFRLNNGMNVIGPIVIFPRTLLSWNVKSVEDITEDSLCLFYMIEPKMDIVVIGMGDFENKIDPKVVMFLRQKGIPLEILPTEQACSTFNFLNIEGRIVAGAFIPPTNITTTMDDIIATKNKRKELFVTEDDLF